MCIYSPTMLRRTDVRWLYKWGCFHSLYIPPLCCTVVVIELFTIMYLFPALVRDSDWLMCPYATVISSPLACGWLGWQPAYTVACGRIILKYCHCVEALNQRVKEMCFKNSHVCEERLLSASLWTWWELAWCIWTLWLNPCAKMTSTVYVSNFLPGLVAQPALFAPSLVFLHRFQDCTFSSEQGFSGSCFQHRWCESPVLLMHAHGAGSILRKSCTLCQPRSAGCSSSQGLISEFAERWRCAGRKETQHTPAGGEWRLIKSMGFLFFFSFFWAAQEISLSSPSVYVAQVSSNDDQCL